MFDFHKLKIWQRALALSVAVGKATRGRGRFAPRGMVSQLTRACRSVHANIAEAGGKSTPRDSARCLDISIGELNEAESHLEEAAAAQVIEQKLATEFITEVQQIRRMTLKFKRWVLRNEE